MLIRRHWLVPDIHGAFSVLWAALCERGFDPQKDGLFSLGDLVNRGPQSNAAAQWLMKPWFRAIRGNHEQMIIDSGQKGGNQQDLKLLAELGGVWWQSLGESEKMVCIGGFESLRLVRTLEVSGRKIGLVHADVPEGVHWDKFVELLENNEPSSRQFALWSRARWQASVGSGLSGSDLPRVEGVDWVFVGHSPVEKPTIVGNVVFLDCGLWRGNANGLICLEDWLEENDPDFKPVNSLVG